jgi:HNH endonuclease
MLTAKRVRELLNYDAATGIFRWRVTRPGHPGGGAAGSRGRKGYHQMRIDRTLYQSSRVAWLYMTGKWPKFELDYINGNRADIRWVNLREATPAQHRAKLRPRSKFGLKGVWITKQGKYVGCIKVKGKTIYLGVFDSLEEASAAYARAAKDLFGAFARAR